MSTDKQVIIAGGGPVGMTLALALAQHGVRSIVAERNPSTTTHPKMDLTNGRSMELFRALGIVDDLRAVGVSPDAPLDIVWATSATGHVLHRFSYPTPNALREQTRVRNDGTGTLEPSMRVSQIVIEPVLKRKIDESPLVDVRFGWSFEAFEQDGAGVTVTLKNSATGAQDSVRALYLAGCDGGGSRVRKQAGIELHGQFSIGDAYMIHFRSTDYAALAKFGAAYHLQTGLGTLIAQNGVDIWTLQAMAPPDSDPDQLMRQFAGREFEYEILVANAWQPHSVLAERYRAGRVFLAGDSAHQVIPTGGYGMNTGIGDAMDLGWKLGAAVQGWGGGTLLDSYEIERRGVAIRNADAALKHAGARFAINELINVAQASCDLDAPENAPARYDLAKKIASMGNAENESWGIEHGYLYHDSPVIIADGTARPASSPAHAPPTTAPGARLPSLYLARGDALYDLLGSGFTLLVIGDGDSASAEVAANELRMPLRIVHLEREPVLDLLEHDFILVRPDHHVAWRASAPPQRWKSILATVCGGSEGPLQ